MTTKSSASKSTQIPDQLFLDAELMLPVSEYHFHSERKWRFDYAWPDVKIALEVEGGVWTQRGHTAPKQFLADLEKYNEAALMGWRVFRTTPQLIKTPGFANLLFKIRALLDDECFFED